MIFDFTPYFLAFMAWIFLTMIVTLGGEEKATARERVEAQFAAGIDRAKTAGDREEAIAARALWRASRDSQLAQVEAQFATELAACFSEGQAAPIRARQRAWRLTDSQA
jgi:hypothetical protein